MSPSPRLNWLLSPVRAVVVLGVLTLVALVVGTGLVLLELRQAALGQARAEIRSLADILAEQSSRAFEGATVALRGAQYRLSDAMGQQLALDSFPVRALLGARTAGLPQIRSMFVIDPLGYTANSSLPSGPPADSLVDRDYFRQVADGSVDLFVSAPIRSRADGKWTVIISCRLTDTAGGFRGVLAVSILLDYFESFYSRVDARQRSRIALLDSQGALVAGATYDPALIGTPVARLPAGLSTARGVAPEVVLVTEEHEGRRRAIAYKTVPQYPLVVAVTMDEAEALHTWVQTARPIVGGASVVFLLILGAASGLIWSLARHAAAERDLRESDERLQQMLQSVTDGIVILDERRVVVFYNRAAEHLFGRTAAEVVGTAFERLLAPASRGIFACIVGNCRESGSCGQDRLGQAEVNGLRADGSEFPAEGSFSTMLFRERQMFTVVLRDLTERHRSEESLRVTHQRLQELSTALQNVREQERAEIAREMHDELGQLLTGIRLELSWLGGRLPAERTDLKDKVGVLKGQLSQTIASVRRITYQLRPLILDDLGLAAAIAWLVDDFSQRTGLEVMLDVDDADEPPRGGLQALCLFRVLQESLTNITKYARASEVWISCRRDRDSWRLTVRDDGVGFDVDAVQVAGTERGGLGLLGMRERARTAGGELSISSAPGEGTQIDIRIPVQAGGEAGA